MRGHVIATIVVALSLSSPSAAQEDTRTHKAFEWLGNAGGWLVDRGSDAVSGLGDATDAQASEENQAFIEELEHEQLQWNDHLQLVADIINAIDDIPDFCRAPSAIELWPDMPDECVAPIESWLVESKTEFELLHNQLHAARQMGDDG